MLSVAKLTPGQEGYYERSVAAGLDDYYAGRGESPGVYAGRGAARLGLAGEVEEGELGALVRGRQPRIGAVLRAHVRGRTIKVERIDLESGRRWLEEKRLAPVAGFDLVFSTPKSVSLLHALAGEETRAAIVEAHRAAWQAALTYLEEEACVTRRGKDGFLRERGGGFVAAAYQHRTSRAQDPHLHTHVIVANMTQSPSDGEWRALDGEAILKTYRLVAGYLYEAQLRFELSTRLGVEWEEPGKGWAELEGVPRAVIDAFSTRRAQLVEHLAAQGTSGFYAAQVAAVATRERKEEVDLSRLREEWRARAAEQGLGRRDLNALLHRSPYREPAPGELVRIAERLLGPQGLTEKRSAFSEPDALMAWAQAHAQGAPAERLSSLAARFLDLPGVERVGDAPAPGKAGYYSTAGLLAAERAALALVERGQDADALAVPAHLLEPMTAADTDRFLLSPEQEEMVRRVATSTDRVVTVVGPAGVGKTAAIRAAAAAFGVAGFPVVGAAPSGIAAERLQDEAGIPSTTLHRLLAMAGETGALPKRCVLIVDEAGMAETRILAPLLRLVEQADGKALLVGDPHQLPSVGAGGLFAAIVERHGAIQLRDNQRQPDALEHQALAALRGGLGRDYLTFAAKRERLLVCDGPLQTRTRLVADWWQAARDDLEGNVMIALRRADVAELNATARALMQAEGRLGKERLEVAGLDFAVGDRVVCRRNRDALGVRNGTRATVVDADPREATLTVETDRGGRALLPRAYLEPGHVQHAYALTGHAGQGLTVERAFVLGSDRSRLQEWGYVALSRARQATRLYVTGEVDEPESHFHQLDQREPLTRLAQALEQSGAERLASEQRPLPAGPRHDTQPILVQQRQDERSGSRLRLLEQRQRETNVLRARAKRRLTAAEENLAGLSWRGRGERGRELQAEIARERSTLRLAEAKLVELAREQERTIARLSLPTETSPIRPSERARELRRERERQLDLDLGL